MLFWFSNLIGMEIMDVKASFTFAGKDMRIIVFGFLPRTKQVVLAIYFLVSIYILNIMCMYVLLYFIYLLCTWELGSVLGECIPYSKSWLHSPSIYIFFVFLLINICAFVIPIKAWRSFLFSIVQRIWKQGAISAKLSA